MLKQGRDANGIEQVTDGSRPCASPRIQFRLGIRVLLNHLFPQAMISLALGCHVDTVSNWKKRFQAGEGVADRPRSGRPTTIPAETDHRLLAFYCQHNPLPGCSRWTIRWARTFLQEHPEILGCSISRSSIHRRLNAHALRPYRSKYFLQISDPHFFEKMDAILAVYANPPELLFCLDECTGLQALQRLAPTLPATGARPACREHEYKRHGTVSILSILRVSTGRVFTDCIPDHTTATVLSSLQKHIRQHDDSQALHYILDNYSPHSTEDFCRGIADVCNIVELPSLKTLPERKQWLQSDDKRIVFHFLPSHGSWLNLIEIWFAILQQKALKDESFRSAPELAARILEFTDTWNTHFAHPFQWTYTGEGLHEKVISRLITWLQIESPELSAKFLGKQIKLMHNLTTAYWAKVNPATWRTLHATILDKRPFIRTIIAADEGSQPHLAELTSLLQSGLEAT